jgi:putative transposase
LSAQLALAIPFRQQPAAAPQRVALPNPEDQAQAEQRYEVLRLALDYQADPNRFGLLRLSDGRPVTSFTRMVLYVSQTSGYSVRTIKYWLSQYRDGGLPALADRKRRDKGESRFFAAYPKAAWLVAYLYLECRQSCMAAYEAIKRDPELVGVPESEICSYETVRSWLDSMPPSLAAYARNGRKAYRERMSPYLRRGYNDVYANACWIGDHALHDVECANDCFADAEMGAPIRIRISAMIDYRSRRVVGASWAWEGSSRAIAATMRRAILQNGPPEHIYIDNGRDYKKVAKGARPGYLASPSRAPEGWWLNELQQIERTGFLARLGIAVTHCLPHHPQSKHIERFFRTMHERFDRCWPTYTSGNPFTRPDVTTVAMMDHRKLMRAGRVAESKHPLASRFILAALAWIEEYNRSPHSGEGMDGASPNEVFEATRNPEQRPTPDPATLTLLMAEHDRRLVNECTVTINKRRYQPTDASGWAVLHERNRRDVLVAYDPGDFQYAAALDLDGHFLAWLEVEQLVRFDPGAPDTQRQIADSMATRRHLEKVTGNAVAEISRVARANGARSPLESLAHRLELPSDTSGIISQRRPRPDIEREPENTLIPGQAADRLAARLRRQRG